MLSSLGPDRIAREYAKLAAVPALPAASQAPTLPHLVMPAHHDVRAEDVIVRRLHGNLAAAAENGPKDYAELLYITPNHLNALCKDLLGIQAGEVIRNRILLEAKRLLTNPLLTITEIALQLNFNDNSYFTKFFKKSTGITPEEFRKNTLNSI